MAKKYYLLIACLIVFAGAGLYYFFKAENPVERPSPDQNPVVTNMVYSGNSIVEEQDGKKIWELSAASIEIDSDTKQAVIKDLKATFYQKNGGTLEVTAPQALYDAKTRDINMNGQVYAATSDGATFTAAAARWSGADRRFYGSGGITVTREDTVITGDQIESDAGIDKVKVTGNARIRKGGAAN